jgi:hypothetical protein
MPEDREKQSSSPPAEAPTSLEAEQGYCNGDDGQEKVYETGNHQRSPSVEKDPNHFGDRMADDRAGSAPFDIVGPNDDDPKAESPPRSGSPGGGGDGGDENASDIDPEKQQQPSVFPHGHQAMKGTGSNDAPISIRGRDGNETCDATDEHVCLGSKKRQRSTHADPDQNDRKRTKQSFNPSRSRDSPTSSSDDESDQTRQNPSRPEPTPHSPLLNSKDSSAWERGQGHTTKALDLEKTPFISDSEGDQWQGCKAYSYDRLVGYRVQKGREEVKVLWPAQYSWEPATEFPSKLVDRIKRRSQGSKKTPRPDKVCEDGRAS